MTISLLLLPKYWGYGHAPWHLALLLVSISYLESLFCLVSENRQCHTFESWDSTTFALMLLKSSGEKAIGGRVGQMRSKLMASAGKEYSTGSQGWCGGQISLLWLECILEFKRRESYVQSKSRDRQIILHSENSSPFPRFTHPTIF